MKSSSGIKKLKSNLTKLKMASVFNEEIKMKTKSIQLNNELEDWQIARLKYKCSITLLGLLEGQHNQDNITRMFKQLQAKLLKDNISDIYMYYDEAYGEHTTPYDEEVFGHVKLIFSAFSTTSRSTPPAS
jgi:hypothetical protein